MALENDLEDRISFYSSMPWMDCNLRSLLIEINLEKRGYDLRHTVTDATCVRKIRKQYCFFILNIQESVEIYFCTSVVFPRDA